MTRIRTTNTIEKRRKLGGFCDGVFLLGWVNVCGMGVHLGEDGKEWRWTVIIWCRGVLCGEENGSGKSVEVLRCVLIGNVRWREGIDGRE